MYRKQNSRFFHYPSDGSKSVILIHGWGVRAVFMDRLAHYFLQEGYSVWNYDYPTSKYHIPEHGKQFLEKFRKEPISGDLYFVTHSMGGLVLRYALSEMTGDECSRIKSIVMLGPPNGGSVLAFPGKLPLVSILNRSWGDMIPGSKILQIPPPVKLPPIGIIAGTRDEKVSFRSTTLPDLPFERTSVPASHPGLRHPERTGEEILTFFRTQKFQ